MSIQVSDRTRLQKLFISVNTPFITRGFWVKIPVYGSCAAGAILGNFGRFLQFWAHLGFSGLFLHKYAVYKGFLAQNILLQSLFPVNVLLLLVGPEGGNTPFGSRPPPPGRLTPPHYNPGGVMLTWTPWGRVASGAKTPQISLNIPGGGS